MSEGGASVSGCGRRLCRLAMGTFAQSPYEPARAFSRILVSGFFESSGDEQLPRIECCPCTTGK